MTRPRRGSPGRRRPSGPTRRTTDRLYLVDTSALARMPNPVVAARLEPLFDEGVVATCAVVDLETLYSARSLRVYEAVLAERRGLVDLPVTPAVTRRAVAVQHGLARRGQHRLAIQDLLIAATAEQAGATVLHYDADYERIARVSGQRHEWVVARGSVS